MIKAARTIAVFLCTTLLLHGPAPAAGLEYPEVYKTPRALGMGGAGVALGDHPDALFTNPAGLAGLPEGWRVKPFTLTVASSPNTESFVQSLRNALDIDETDPQREALVEVLRRYRGQNLHGEAVLLPGVSWRRGNLAVSFAWLAAAKLDGRSHEGFGAVGLLEVDGRTLTGPLLGLAWSQGNWRIGATAKQLRRDRVSRTYSVRELIELTDAGRSIHDDREAGSAFGVDLGLQYALEPRFGWQPRLGVVVQNVGDIDFGPAGEIPQTMTLGLSFKGMESWFSGLTLSAEYFDVLQGMPQDDSHAKRMRMGVEWALWDRTTSTVALRAGLYQQEPTAGFEWRTGWFSIGLATYAEELGAHAGQDSDRRYLLTTGLEF